MLTAVDVCIVSDQKYIGWKIFSVYHDPFSAENKSKIHPTIGNSAF